MSDQARFPDVALFRGFNEPVRAEVDVRDLQVIDGEVPQALRGTLYRCGPETQYPPMSPVAKKEVDIPFNYEEYFNGEGMVHSFRFEGGQVGYRSRWVRNERFLAQDPAYRAGVLGSAPRVAVEAASPFGWTRYIASEDHFVGMRSFGASGPYQQVYEHFGITPEAVVGKVKDVLG